MDVPLGWCLDTQYRYKCMCRNFRSYDPVEVKQHINEDGYCLNGLKCVAEGHYECICGKQFNSRDAWNHAEDQLEYKIENCMRKHYSFCKTCNIQLQSVAAFKIHCNTRKHTNPREEKCKVCDVKYQGKKHKEEHLLTAKHKQRMEEGTLPLTCEVCQITCDSQKKMKAHLETNKHKKKLDQNEL